jgi:hypothetical protein
MTIKHIEVDLETHRLVKAYAKTEKLTMKAFMQKYIATKQNPIIRPGACPRCGKNIEE